MILSIIVPFYNEKSYQLRPLLNSISIQKGIDFNNLELIYVNDGFNGKDKVPLTFFEQNCPCQYIVLEGIDNRGPGVNRQRGLDKAKGKYVMFCDCDDILQNAGILGAMLQEMENKQLEVLTTHWLEEIISEEKIHFIDHHQEFTWMHGKMFLRKFLTYNDICFHSDLRVHEDTYFLNLVSALSEKKAYLPVTSYIWNYNPESITRKENAIYSFSSMSQFCYSVIESLKNLLRRGQTQFIQEQVIQHLCYIYVVDQSSSWTASEIKKYREEMKESLAKNIFPLWSYWETASKEDILRIYKSEIGRLDNFPETDFKEWILNIKNRSLDIARKECYANKALES